MRFKKIFSICILFMSLYATAETREGNVVYSVSDSNQLIYLRFPYKTEITLIENVTLPSDSRFSLSIYGQWNGSIQNPDVKKILNRYPHYRVAEQSFAAATRSCEITLSTGRKLECLVPSGTGNYFSVFEVLDQKEGDTLKKQLTKQVFPQFKVYSSYQVPKILSSETTHVSLAAFYQQLVGSDAEIKKVLVSDLIQNLVQSVNRENIRPVLQKKYINTLLSETVSEFLDPVQLVASFSDLLKVELTPKKPSQEVMVLSEETLGWNMATLEVLNDLMVKVVEGTKK